MRNIIGIINSGVTAKNLNNPGACANPTAVNTFLKGTFVCLSGNNFTPITYIKNGNFTVRQIAEAAQRSMPDSELIFLNEKSKIDPRTYKVSFKKIYNDLGSYYKPKWKLDDGAKELIEFFKETNFTKNYFNGYKTNRLIALKKKLKI